MNLNNTEMQELIDLIRTIARQEIKNNSINLEYSYFGTIESTNPDGTFNVKIPSDNGIYPNLLNQTGTTLTIGDSVLIRAKNNKMGNAYIAVKNGATIS